MEDNNHEALIIGELMRHHRQKVGMTQAELSKKTGINQSTLSRHEKGLICPRADELEKIAQAFDIPLHVFWELMADVRARFRSALAKLKPQKSVDTSGIVAWCVGVSTGPHGQSD